MGIIIAIAIIATEGIYFFTPISWGDVPLEGEYQMKITVNGHELNATMENNPSAQAFKQLLKEGPKTISMSDYESMEKVGLIGQTLLR